MSTEVEVDLLVVGAGTAGLPCAMEAAARGARVLVCEKSDDIGGTLHISGGHLSGAGTRRQRERGIDDAPERHVADVLRISDGTAREDIVRLAAELGPRTIDWLDDLGIEWHEASPRIVHGHEPYGIARTHYGVHEARSILAVLRPRFEQLVADGRVELWLESPVVALRHRDGAVVGATVARPDGTRTDVSARSTVLATGGYGADPQRFERLDGRPLFSAARATSTGDGLDLATAAGGAIAGTGCFIPTFGGLATEEPHRIAWPDRVHLVATERPPWELYVDRHGKRFVAEDEPSIDAKERRLFERVPDLTFHVVLDERARLEGAPLFAGASKDELVARAGRAPGVVVADDLSALATLAGIDGGGLQATVDAYNQALLSGRADPLGRRYRPAPIDRPPFYAVRNHGATLITFAGVDVDARLQVRDDDGRPVPGLYAAGEVLGAAATSGNSFCGGMAITPALGFGRMLGQQLPVG